MTTQFKRPVSVLVVIHTCDLEVLLLERALHPGYWQSVTGSQEDEESLIETAVREVREETGIVAATTDIDDWQTTNTFEIFEEWRHRYAPNVTHNKEHVFSLEVAKDTPVHLSPSEHIAYCWLDYRSAAAKVFSWSNRDAILQLSARLETARG
ncbi:MAG: dihydroneopterin triphosphate diphosphatase [Propionivibrio sp.]|nr:dihydroneopterin triphosphate diphosphatase [Propionivibrio sp.]MBP6710430.1 dihydroneopterin triphosphate diphosphatase [Propionivibrio sp.]MBP7523832.1 dihydroneopterin triphosphate diphosphatase [Propionivibrio sp.]